MSEITLVLAGESAAAERAAVALETALGGAENGVRRLPPKELPEITRRVVDPISLAALVLAVPGALVAALDIADRIRGKRKRASELVETAKRVRHEQRVEALIINAEGVSLALADLDADKVLDLADAIERPGLAGSGQRT